MKKTMFMLLLVITSAVKLNAQAMASFHESINYNYAERDLTPMSSQGQTADQNAPVQVKQTEPVATGSPVTLGQGQNDVKQEETVLPEQKKERSRKLHADVAFRNATRKMWIGTKRAGQVIAKPFRHLGCKTCPHFRS